MTTYKDLNEKEKNMLLKFPVYVSLLAASHDHKIDLKEKKEALKLTHIKSFASDPRLREYYAEVEKHFEENLVAIDSELPKEKEYRKKAIEAEIQKAEEILKKLGRLHDETFRQSLRSYIDHVSKVHGNVLGYFVFPLSIKGFID